MACVVSHVIAMWMTINYMTNYTVIRVGIYALTQVTVAKCETFAAFCTTAVCDNVCTFAFWKRLRNVFANHWNKE